MQNSDNNLKIQLKQYYQNRSTDKILSKSGSKNDDQYRVKWNKSIQFKFSIILSIVTFLILLTFTTLTATSMKRRMTDELNQLAENTAKKMSKSMIAPLWELDETQAKENIFSEMQEKKIFGILIKDNDINAVFQGGKRDKYWQIQQTKKSFSDDLISSIKPIKKDGEILGTIEVYVSKKYMNAESFRSVKNLMLATLFLIISILFITLHAMKRIVVEPISSLVEIAENISLGNLEAKIEHPSEDEIGHLAIALDRMRKSLKIMLSRHSERSHYQ